MSEPVSDILYGIEYNLNGVKRYSSFFSTDLDAINDQIERLKRLSAKDCRIAVFGRKYNALPVIG